MKIDPCEQHAYSRNDQIMCPVCLGRGFIGNYKNVKLCDREKCPRCKGEKLIPMLESFKEEAAEKGLTGEALKEYLEQNFYDLKPTDFE